MASYFQHWNLLTEKEMQALSNDEILELNGKARAFVRMWRTALTCSSFEHDRNKCAYGKDYRVKIRNVEKMYKRLTEIYQKRNTLKLWE